MVKSCLFNNLIEWKDIFNIMWKCLLTDSVKIITSCYFFLSDSTEFLIVQIDCNTVVNVWPLRSHVNLMTIVCVSLKEIWCLMEVFKYVVLCNCAILSLLPTVKWLKSLIEGDFFACSETFQVCCQHLLIILILRESIRGFGVLGPFLECS